MSSEETRRIVQSFVADGESCWLADDVVLHDVPRRHAVSGRTAVVRRLAALPEPNGPAAVLAEGDRATATWPATSASYEVSGGEITRIALYYDSASLVLSGGNTAGTPGS